MPIAMAPAVVQARPAPRVTYLSVGDSLAAGYQPAGGYQHGYADQLFAAMRRQVPGLELAKLGCGGETASSMITRSSTPSRSRR
jgi:hypothetical protein